MILGTSRAVRVFAYPEPVDLRKGYDGLFGLVKTGLGRDPLSGDLFLFLGKRRNDCKVLKGRHAPGSLTHAEALVERPHPRARSTASGGDNAIAGGDRAPQPGRSNPNR